MTKRSKKATPDQVLDQFLAAPDTLRKNSAELGKARARKAKEEADRQRILSTKARRPPSTEDLIADLVRVAEDRETNPFWKFRAVSRRRYELFGHFPVQVVDQQFGTFQHFKEVAGLADQPGTRLWRANRADESRREHARRYLERWVAPYVARSSDYKKIQGRDYHLMSISDTHSQFLCPFVWSAFLEFVRLFKPDGVLFNGDTLEGAEISRHVQIPGWTEPFQSECDFQREMMRQVREVAGHQGDIFYTAGNHDVDRLAMYLTQNARALTGMRCLRVDELFGLKDFDVRMMTGGTIMSPVGTEDAKSGFLMFDFYRPHHGTFLGSNPAAKELASSGRSGQSGHIHRAFLVFGSTEKDEGLSHMCTPMGARNEVGRAYMPRTGTGWQRGFGNARLFADGSCSQYPVVVVGSPERLTCEGVTLFRPANMKDPRPHGQWLK